MRMMQGDQYRIPISLKKSDGSFITLSDLEYIEIFIGKNIRKTLADITYSENKFYVPVLQNETFRLKGTADIQARIRFAGSQDIIGINLGTIDIDNSISKVVI